MSFLDNTAHRCEWKGQPGEGEGQCVYLDPVFSTQVSDGVVGMCGW